MPYEGDFIQMADETKTVNEGSYPVEGFKELVDVGLFYGRVKSKTHPRMRPYILMTRNGVEVINLAKTKEAVEVACEFVKEKVAKGGGVLFLGTQPQAHAVSQFVEMGFPAVTRRWLGGTLTNFRIISRRIEYFKKLKTDFAASAFDRYTKKERLGIEKELVRLEELFHRLINKSPTGFYF
jgi:small subunit ribosomal protein S2